MTFKPSAPIFAKADPSNLNFRRQIFQQNVRRGMKAQTRRDEPHEWRIGTQLDSREIAESLKISLALVPSDAQPIIHRLQRQLNIFRRLQLDYHEPSAVGHAEQIQHAAIPGRQRRSLRVKMARVELSVELRWVFANDRFQPSLRRGAK